MNMEIHPYFPPSLSVFLLCLVLSITYKIITTSNISQVSEDLMKNKAVESSVHINAYMWIKIHNMHINFLCKVF